jgi:hypothetical protein
VGSGLLRLSHVQFWKTKNSCRLDRSHRGDHRRYIPGLVDASDVRTVNAIKLLPAWSMISCSGFSASFSASRCVTSKDKVGGFGLLVAGEAGFHESRVAMFAIGEVTESPASSGGVLG